MGFVANESLGRYNRRSPLFLYIFSPQSYGITCPVELFTSWVEEKGGMLPPPPDYLYIQTLYTTTALAAAVYMYAALAFCILYTWSYIYYSGNLLLLCLATLCFFFLYTDSFSFYEFLNSAARLKGGMYIDAGGESLFLLVILMAPSPRFFF